MCIIVAKPMNVEMPEEKTLRRCFSGNPDGAGFMWADGKTVHIRKGFMTFDSFIDALYDEIPERDEVETAVVMHFRIATHGKVQQCCCHPFPISDDKKELMSTATASRMGIAHNGVISGRRTNDNWSDTMDFVANVVTPLMRMNPSFMHNSNAIDLLEGACGSKLAIMDNAGDIVTVGNFVEDGGVLYSNNSFQATVWNWSSYGDFWGSNYWESYGGTKAIAKYDLDYEDDDYEAAFGDKLEELIDALPFEACGSCLWNEECALTFPCCDTEKFAHGLSADLEEEVEYEKLVESGLATADDEDYYECLKDSNDFARMEFGR